MRRRDLGGGASAFQNQRRRGNNNRGDSLSKVGRPLHCHGCCSAGHSHRQCPQRINQSSSASGYVSKTAYSHTRGALDISTATPTLVLLVGEESSHGHMHASTGTFSAAAHSMYHPSDFQASQPYILTQSPFVDVQPVTGLAEEHGTFGPTYIPQHPQRSAGASSSGQHILQDP